MNDYGSGDTLRNLPAITLASADHTRFTREMHRQGYSSERVFARVLILEALAERAKKTGCHAPTRQPEPGKC